MRDKGPKMENKTKKKKVAANLLFNTLFLAVYGTILYMSDPEWIVWAGSMTMGVLCIGDIPPAIQVAPVEALRVASIYGLFGLLALVFFVETAEEKRVRNVKSAGGRT